MDEIMGRVKEGHALLKEAGWYPALDRVNMQKCFDQDGFTFRFVD